MYFYTKSKTDYQKIVFLRVRAHYSENTSVRSKSQEFSRKFKRSGVCFNDYFVMSIVVSLLCAHSHATLFSRRLKCIFTRNQKLK